MTTTTAPQQQIEIGLHLDVPAEVYHSWEAASNSRLGHMLRSPAHCRHRIDNPEESDAMLLGSALHCRVLQPSLFASEFATRPDCDRRTKEGKVIYDKFLADSAGKRELLACDAEDVAAMAKSIFAHPAASNLLADPGAVELSGVFVDPRTELLCKLRTDKLNERLRAVVDVKTTGDASAEGFTKSIFNFGYHRQAAFYLDGLKLLGLALEHFILIAVEKERPYGVGVYRLADDAVDAGRVQLRPLMERYAQCVESGKWPSYSKEIQDISLPAWAFKQIG